MLWLRLLRARTALALLLLLSPALLAAQETGVDAPPPPDPNVQHQAEPEEQTPAETLKVNVDVVNIFCNVKDKHGALIPDLKKEDFELNEDGKPQAVKYFSAESNQPLTLGILLDTSPSQGRVLPMEQEAGAQFLDEVLRANDEAFLINFDTNVELEQDYTNNKRRLREAMNKAKINGGGVVGGAPGIGQGPLPTAQTPRGTKLYDAVYLASNEKLAREVGRKAMILLTDGEDQGSYAKIGEAIEAAQKADAICYVILIADRGYYGGFYSGDQKMKEMTEQTGGRVIDVGNSFDKLKKAFDQIASELRTQYALGYTPTNGKKDGTFRKIDVKTKEGYKVQARRGYYAIEPKS